MQRTAETNSNQDPMIDQIKSNQTSGVLRSIYRKLPAEFGILIVLIGIALFFEVLGWIFVGQSFLANQQRLIIMILQMAIIGIIAVGVTQVIIMAGIDLSGGSVLAFAGIVAASLAQTSDYARAVYPALTDLPVAIPVIAGIFIGVCAGFINGSIIALTAQSGAGIMYELDAISAVVIGGTSLFGGKGRMTGTFIGVFILGVITSGFTFLRIDSYYQEIAKGAIIVTAIVFDQYRQRKRAKAQEAAA
jgi:ribose/xylose/arabinose/galactoside ABC-type transport system permease subunit